MGTVLTIVSPERNIVGSGRVVMTPGRIFGMGSRETESDAEPMLARERERQDDLEVRLREKRSEEGMLR